jgi:hypothetical protein
MAQTILESLKCHGSGGTNVDSNSTFFQIAVISDSDMVMITCVNITLKENSN